MSNITLSNISQIPIENIVASSMESLLELALEANNAFIEARGLKDWIDGVITIKKSINNNLGGENEQTTDY